MAEPLTTTIDKQPLDDGMAEPHDTTADKMPGRRHV